MPQIQERTKHRLGALGSYKPRFWSVAHHQIMKAIPAEWISEHPGIPEKQREEGNPQRPLGYRAKNPEYDLVIEWFIDHQLDELEYSETLPMNIGLIDEGSGADIWINVSDLVYEFVADNNLDQPTRKSISQEEATEWINRFTASLKNGKRPRKSKSR